MEAQTSYNRILEKEADLVGLKLLAKAGYDPTIALEVWTKMAELDVEMKKEGTVVTKTKNDTTGDPSSHQKRQYKDLEIDVRQFVDTLLQAWFGSSHPPSQERLEYMQANMQDAIRIYEESLRINGPPQEYQFKSREPLSQIQETDGRSLHIWISSVFSWISMYFS
ncbi:hypothetical protein BDF14DRAFT_374545 [Spinellus fusiger]|nr:hypothetical protein BDF14DRAFT_374545 [Spinellus fusiger]